MILRGRKDMKINDSFIAEAKNLGLEIDIEKNDCAIRFPLKSGRYIDWKYQDTESEIRTFLDGFKMGLEAAKDIGREMAV